MPDIASISAALSGLKTAAEISKTFLELKSISEVQSKVIELQNVILGAQSSALDAQSAQSTLLDRIRSLEDEASLLKSWEAEKQRYKMHEPKTGVITYVLKGEIGSDEPIHHLCAGCYENNTRSILQEEYRMPGRCRVLMCHKCGLDLYLDGDWVPEHSRRRRNTKR